MRPGVPVCLTPALSRAGAAAAAGAAAEPPWLHVFTGEWDRPAHEVAALVEGYVTGFRHWRPTGSRHADRSARPQRAPARGSRRGGAEVVQVFLSNPSPGASLPPARCGRVADVAAPRLRARPYLINVASPNNRVRIPRAPSWRHVGGGGGGGRGRGGGARRARRRRRGSRRRGGAVAEALEAVERRVPVLLENTAGGATPVLREVARLGPLWEAIGHFGVGCADTCTPGRRETWRRWSSGCGRPPAASTWCTATNSRDPFGSRGTATPISAGERSRPTS